METKTLTNEEAAFEWAKARLLARRAKKMQNGDMWFERIARPEQKPPEFNWWTIWLFMAGRGAGKTRAGAEDINRYCLKNKGVRVALVGPTAGAVRDIMVEGESGLLSINPSIQYEPSKRKLTWPNGSMALTYSSERPDRLRGPQHHRMWADELGAWTYAQDTWDMAMFGLRLGKQPQALVTTTPKNTKLIRELLARKSKDVAVSRSTTYANAANLAPTFLSEIVARYEGTRLGKQEIEGELLEDIVGALWTQQMLIDCRVGAVPEGVDMVRCVVAIDPSGGERDEQGIVVAARGSDGNYYILEDASCLLSPSGWAKRAVSAYERWSADKIVAEKNYGGQMVEETIRAVDRNIRVRMVNATRGKQQRAEPIAALYEQGKVFHVGEFSALEEQMTNWTPDSGESPDRMDALVWALTELSSRTGLRILG